MAVSYRALPSRILKAHSKVSANYKWIRDNYETLHKEYPDEFIAVVNRKVAYHTKTYDDLLKYLYENRDRPDLVTSHTHSAGRILLR